MLIGGKANPQAQRWEKEARVDPATSTIIAAVVQASGGVLQTVIKLYYGANPDTETQKHAAKIIQKTYNTLRWDLTGGSVRVLKLLENGQLQRANMVRKSFYPNLQVLQEHGDPLEEYLDNEFGYRLQYLRVHGLVGTAAGGLYPEYGITALGLAFLQEARHRRAYLDVL
jgi:hypothetical protein